MAVGFESRLRHLRQLDAREEIREDALEQRDVWGKELGKVDVLNKGRVSKVKLPSSEEVSRE